MVEEEQFSVEAPWGMIRGVTWGNPAHPPVLLVPGKMHVCTGYGPLVKLLPHCFYFVAIDLPGNGMSDPLPRGISLTIFDMLPAIQVVKRKLGWDHFIYMGHSLGALIGKMYDLVHPGDISRMVELDPTPAHHNWDTTREDLRRWHRTYYGSYEENKYCKFHGSLETAPKYTYEKARQMLLKHADMTEEACEQVLKRSLVPAGNGLFRFTFDQRMKEVTVLPFSAELLKKIYTSSTTVTFAVIAKGEIEKRFYNNCEFVWDLKAWPNNNYRFKMVEGTHNVHIYNPETMAEDIGKFLLEHFKAKL